MPYSNQFYAACRAAQRAANRTESTRFVVYDPSDEPGPFGNYHVATSEQTFTFYAGATVAFATGPQGD